MQRSAAFHKTIRSGFSAFRAALLSILVFEIIYKAVTLLAAKPLLSLLMQLLLRIGGNGLVFNENIWRFALTLPGIIAILVLTCIAAFCIYFEFAMVISLARQALGKEDVSIRAAIVHSLWALKSLVSPDFILFAFYALILLPLVNMGVTSSLVPTLTIPNFITGELAKTIPGALLLLGFAALLFLLFFCQLFVLPAMVLDRFCFLKAVKKNVEILRTYGFKLLGVLLVFLFTWGICFLVPRQVFTFFFGTASVSFTEAAAYYGFSLQTPVMLLIWLLASLLQLILMPLLLVLLTACYTAASATLTEPEEDTCLMIQARLDKGTKGLQSILKALGRFALSAYHKLMARPFVRKHRRLLAVLMAGLLIWTIARTLVTGVGIHDPAVIGYRGSAYGVENTLEAIQYAIDAGADYAEVDVLLSADGVPMVIHDVNLRRLTGQDRNVYDFTAEQLQQIPLHQNGLTAYIPTLKAVVEYCEGKILLAVEYKLHGREQVDLITEVMRVMMASAYQKDSIYLSLDYNLVVGMKEQYPQYRAGYCVYGNVGRLTAGSLRDMNIDFLLVEEQMVSRPLLNACRKAWVPVFVWTANDSSRMGDYLRLGVTGLVTDYPDLAMEVLGTMYNLDDMLMPPETG